METSTLALLFAAALSFVAAITARTRPIPLWLSALIAVTALGLQFLYSENLWSVLFTVIASVSLLAILWWGKILGRGSVFTLPAVALAVPLNLWWALLIGLILSTVVSTVKTLQHGGYAKIKALTYETDAAIKAGKSNITDLADELAATTVKTQKVNLFFYLMLGLLISAAGTLIF